MRDLIRHPSRDTIGAEAGREPEARPAHGEVADQIPEQSGELGDGGEEGEEGAVELLADGISWRQISCVGSRKKWKRTKRAARGDGGLTPTAK